MCLLVYMMSQYGNYIKTGLRALGLMTFPGIPHVVVWMDNLAAVDARSLLDASFWPG